ncbi:MAG: CHAT domain-containing protein, partial [Bacteroidota bacterium]|nr:CHAT domain-containing protein [Bacteroidota bacterium]
MNRDSLRKRIIFLRDSFSADPHKQLAEFLSLKQKTTSCPLKYDSVYTLLLQRIAAVYYKLHDLKNSEKCIQSTVQLIQNNSTKTNADPKQLVRDYYILSLIYDSLGGIQEKIRSQDSCISISLRVKQYDVFVLYTIENLVTYYYDLGDYHRCISFAQEGELLIPKIIRGKDSLQYLQNFIMWKVNSYIFVHEYEEAEKVLKKSMQNPELLNSGNFSAAVYERMADIEIYHTDYSRGLSYYKQSLAYSKKNSDYFRYMQTLVNMGYNLYSSVLNDKSQALNCYQKALQFSFLAKKNASVADLFQIQIQKLNIYSNIASVYTKSGLFDSARFFFHKAFSQINNRMDEFNVLDSLNKILVQNNAAIYLFSTLLDLGDSYLEQYKSTKNNSFLRRAAQIYYTTDKLVIRIKSSQNDERSLLFWEGHLRRLYEHAIDAYYLLENTDGALYFFEKSRAILLNDQLRKQAIAGSDALYELAQVKRRILKISMACSYLDPFSNQYKILQNELFANTESLNLLEQSIKNKNPLYYKFILDTNRITVKDIRSAILKDHCSIFEVFNGDSAVYTLTITPTTSFIRKIEKKQFDKIADFYTTYIANAVLLNKEYPQYLHVASQLFDLLLKDIPIPKGRIIISPDGKYFPFEALVTNNDYSSPQYFLSDYIVSYTYSALFLLNDYTKNTGHSNGAFLGIAPVHYPMAFNLSSLSKSDISLEKISSLFKNTKTLVESHASKGNFMHQMYAYKTIQLYTHATDNRNGEPVIFFFDSSLSLSELIPEKQTAAQLIVLSACETGNGKLYKGEGVFSFNRGFAALGIPSSVIN